MSLPWLQDDFKESSKSRSRSPLQKEVKPAEPLPLKSRSRSLSPRKSKDRTSRHSRDSSRTRKKIERRTRHLRGKKRGSSSSSRSSSGRSSSSYSSSSSSSSSGSTPTRIIASMRTKYRKARLYITNIVSKETTRADLIKHFKKYGEVLDVLIHVNNYAFIQYGTEEEARAAVDGEHGQTFKQKEINVKLAREPRSWRKNEKAGASRYEGTRRGRKRGAGRAARRARMRMQEKMGKNPADEPGEKFEGGRNPERKSPPYLPSRQEDPHAPPRGGPYPPLRGGPYPHPPHGEPFPPPHHRGPFPPHPMVPGPDSYRGRRPRPMYGPDPRDVDPYFVDRYRRGPPEPWGPDGPYRPGEFEGPYRDGFRPPHQPAECEIFVKNPGLLPYGEYVEERIKSFSIVTAVSVKPPHISPIQLMEDLRAQRALFAIFINVKNEEYKSMTLNVLHSQPQEHRNMPMEDAITYIMDSFHSYVEGLKKKAKGDALKPPGISSGSFLQASPDVAYLLHLLADNRNLTYEELDTIIQYLTKRRDKLVNPLKSRSLLDEDISRSDHGPAEDYLRSPENHRRSPGSQHRSLDSRQRSPEDNRRSPEDRCKSPEDHNRSPEDRRRSSEDHRRSPEEGYRKPQQNHRRSSDKYSPPIHPDDMFQPPKEENPKPAKAPSSQLAQDLKSKILNILNSVRSGQGVQATDDGQRLLPTGVPAPTPPIQAPPPLPPMPSLPTLPVKDFDNFQNSVAQDSVGSMFPNNSSGLSSMNTNIFQGNTGLSSVNTSIFQGNAGLGSLNTNMFQSNSGLNSMNSGFQDNLKGSSSMPATSQNMAASDFPSSYEAVGGGYNQGTYGQDTAQSWRMAPQDDYNYVGGLRPHIEQEARPPAGMPYPEDYNYPGMPNRMGQMGNLYRPPRY
ncbi:hypothetical protein BsWGS_22466 [Bradybaena similaris]